jgi:uncharacterized protein
MRRGQRVGITSLSHKAIHKVLENLRGAALEAGFTFKGRKKAGGEESFYEDDFVDCTGSNDEMLDDELQLLAGTSFLFAREELDGCVETLFVDEAGQVRWRTCWRSGPPRGTWCCSATRTSSLRFC